MKLLHFFLFLLFCSSVHTAPQVEFFINCGSSTNATTTDGRVFVGDEKAASFRLFGHSSKAVSKQADSNSLSLYHSVRIFKKPSAYVFDIPQNGTYLLRLHFYAFSSPPTLAEAQFDVSASGHMLLPDFSMGSNAANSLVLKEFFIYINATGKFRVHFVPNHVSPSIAFVNAIELLYTSLNITVDTGPDVTPGGSKEVYKVRKSEVFETMYRINVGGNEVNDSLWRTWRPDDQYLINKVDAKNAPIYSTGVNYDHAATSEDASTPEDAPLAVYETAKLLTEKSFTVIPNLTWQFNISKDARFLVRAHFCNIISSLGPYMFNLYIYGKFGQEIKPTTIISEVGAPFHMDYIVESENFEFINISVGSNNRSLNQTYLFLNGLEIMQVKNGTAADPACYGKTHKIALIVGIAGTSMVLIVILVAVVLLCRRKKKGKHVEEFEWAMISRNGATSSDNRTSNRSSSHGSNLQNLHLSLKIPFRKIQEVTRNFDADLMVGKGGFGKVYKGTLKDGSKVAVKRSNPDHGQGLAEFQAEIMVLSKIRHRHLVSLIGYCCEEGEMILVYEFMENGTLREHLYGSGGNSPSSDGTRLSWKQRLEICIGAAKGLHYLHTGADGGIIHRDVKSTNILLDECYVAKVADFGLSRLAHLEEADACSGVKGTFGYLDPEYISCLQLTEKSDVYSFGVVLVEVLCARPVIDRSIPRHNLAEWVMACHEEEQLEKIIDPSIAGEINPNSLKKFIETAAKCLKDCAVDRPSMSDILWDLEYALQFQKAAMQRDLPGDSMTDASLNSPLPADRHFPSQSFADMEDNAMFTFTSTGDVFTEMRLEDDVGR